MLTTLFLRFPMPKSLRKQFGLVLTIPAILILAGGLVAFYDSRLSTQKTRQLVEVRMIRLQQAQDLARHTLLIERGSNQLLTTDTMDAMRASYLEIKTLRGIIPICSSCKKIRDDKGYWNRIETYISKHSDADFSHGICPECIRKLYPDIDLENN